MWVTAQVGRTASVTRASTRSRQTPGPASRSPAKGVDPVAPALAPQLDRSYEGPISVGALLRREGRRASHALDRPVVPRARDVRHDESGGTAHGIALTGG